MATISVPVRNLTKQMTLNVQVTGLKELAVRMKIAVFLLRLVGKVIGCNISVDMDKI